MPARFFIFLFIYLWLALSAQTADIRWISVDGDRFDGVYFGGRIIEGDLQKLDQIISINKWKKDLVIGLYSEGGSVAESIKIGRYIRYHGFHTYINNKGYCYSACFFIFIGGSVRNINDGGELGVHQFYGGRGSADDVEATTQHLTAELIDYTLSMGVSIETMTIASRTLPHDMHIFNATQIKRYNITGNSLSQDNDPLVNESHMSASRLTDGIFWQQDGWTVMRENGSSGNFPYCAMRKFTKIDGLFSLETGRQFPSMMMVYANKDNLLSRLIKGNKKQLKPYYHLIKKSKKREKLNMIKMARLIFFL